VVSKLRVFANVMNNVLRYMKGKGNQQRLLTLAACLAEGPHHSRYITGGGNAHIALTLPLREATDIRDFPIQKIALVHYLYSN